MDCIEFAFALCSVHGMCLPHLLDLGTKREFMKRYMLMSPSHMSNGFFAKQT